MVIEHQMLKYDNVASVHIEADDKMIPYIVSSIPQNISAVDLRVCGNIIISRHGSDTELLIPVDRAFECTKHYAFKPRFKLVNALRSRCYGGLGGIGTVVDELRGYITERLLCPVTEPFIEVKDAENGVYDVYIGISENVL